MYYCSINVAIIMKNICLKLTKVLLVCLKDKIIIYIYTFKNYSFLERLAQVNLKEAEEIIHKQ